MSKLIEIGNAERKLKGSKNITRGRTLTATRTRRVRDRQTERERERGTATGHEDAVAARQLSSCPLVSGHAPTTARE